MIFLERALKVMFRLSVKLSVIAMARESAFDAVKFRARKNALKEAISTSAPEAPAIQKNMNFFLIPILVNRGLII